MADSIKVTGSDLDREVLRRRLLDQRNQIMKLYQQDLQAGKDATDEESDDLVDRANNAYNRELMFSLSDNERTTLLLVESALRRMENGAYGVCANCGKQIGGARLEAVPWARFCIDCQELAEQGLLDEEALEHD